jgi:O-antigen/teichoic acid export membrane protein
MDFFNNDAVLGLWLTVLSVLTWMLNFDFGIGNGLRNHLTRCVSEKNFGEAKHYVSSAYVSIGGVCLGALGVYLAVFRFINWNWVFNIQETSVSSETLLLAVTIVFVGILLQMFLRNVNSTLYALQLSSVNNAMALCSSVLTLIAVLVIPSGNNDRNLIVMAVVHLLAVAIPQLAATILVFGVSRYKVIAPSISTCSKSHAKQVLSLGGSFFFVQFMFMLIMNTNEFLVNFLTGGDLVVDYANYHKIFTLGGTVISLALTPVWSAVTKAFAEKNYKWVRSLYKKLLLLGLAGVACEFMIIPFLQFGFDIWLGEKTIPVHYGYAVTFACMGSMLIFNSVVASIANGLGKLRTQAVCYTIGAVMKFLLSYLLIDLLGSWIGVLIANVVALGIYCVVQPFVLHRTLKRLDQLS